VVTCPSCGESNVEDAAFCAYCGTPLVTTAPTKERRFLTILFADLVGFTAESDEADPEDVQARLIPYHQRLRQEIERYDGTVEKLIGDGVMAVFGVPTAHEDDPERAVRVALRIQTAVDELNAEHEALDLSVRIGINSGEAVVTTGGEGERIVGDVVNTASRIESIAPPGGVVVGEATHRATDLLIEYEDMDAVEVKGKSKPLAVWRAIEARGRYGIDAAVRSPTPFLGRATEMSLLTETFRRVIDDGTLQLVTVSAAAGVGKSRLVNEFWQWVDDQPEIVWWRQGRNLPYGEGITFWALGEIVKGQAGIRESDTKSEAAAKLSTALEAIVDDPADRDWLSAQLSPLVGAGSETQVGDRSEAFSAWRRFLEDMADVQPLVMVIEDLHWADDALIEFLRDLLVWSADVPIMVICTTRPELFESHPEWGGGQRNSATVSLAPLTDDHIAKLLSALLEQAVLPAETQQALLDRAGGNPLYAEEFVRMLNDRGMLHGRAELDATSAADIPVPETVQALIGSRLDILSADEGMVIQDASVVGKVFWEGALTDMADGADVSGALRQLVERDWIRPVRNSSVEGQREYAFWHALTRDVAYGRIPREARADKHGTVAVWIEATTGERASDHAELLAHHYLSALELADAAGKSDTAILRQQATRTLVMAGDRAMGLDAARASGYYQHALDLMGAEDSARAGLLVLAGQAMQEHLGHGPSIPVFEEATRLASVAEDPLTAGRAWLYLSEAQRVTFGVVASEDALDQAIRLLESQPPSQYLAAAYLERAAGYMLRGDLEEQAEWAERGIKLAERLDLDESKARGLSIRGIARFDAGDIDGGMTDLRESVVIADSSAGRTIMRLVAYINLADYTRKASSPAEAQDIYERGIALAKERGADTSWATAETMWSLFDLGRWDEALATGDALLESEHGSGLLDAWAQSYQALVLVWRGDLARAASLQDDYLPALRQIGDIQQLGPALLIAARTELAGGNEPAAVQLIGEFVSATRDISPIFRNLQIADAVRLLTAAGGADEAAALSASPEGMDIRSELGLNTARAIVAEARGDTEQALQQYEELVRGWAGYGHALEHALVLYGAGRCLLALGRNDEAAARLGEAREILGDLGAAPTIAEIDALGDQAAAL
jgi:class 3 adenylate cyclase/tetratricopeptide (TPR) repeat protein